MSQPYIGEIRLFAGNFAPNGWFFCNGQILPISEYETLFNLIGTTYGGDGQSTFALPNLQGRVPIHQGSSGASTYVIGAFGGVTSVTLTQNQIPSHTHPVVASSQDGTANSPAGAVYAAPTSVKPYRLSTPAAAMATPISSTGGSQPHENEQQYVVVNYIISLFGIFPSQS